MRDILFRGKRKDNSEWAYGWYAPISVSDSHGPQMAIVTVEPNEYAYMGYGNCIASPKFYMVDPDTVGQFTGLTDKNGQMIFEDDVVKTKYGRLCVMTWFSSRVCCGWDLKPINEINNIAHTSPPTDFDLWDGRNLEVVDNVHDNPKYALYMEG